MSKSIDSPPAELIAHIDGAARGNPGPASYGVVVESADGAARAAFSSCLGRTTNNVAEYEALLAALDYALRQATRRLVVLSDSELLVRQLEGRYKVKSPDLKPRFERAREMIARLESFRIRHVPRSQNAEADRLANQALDAAARGEGGHKAGH
jgi:ribonuclease HI